MKKINSEEMNEITRRNIMTKQIGSWFRNLFFLSVLFLVITLWGFLGFNDSFLQVGMDVRNVIKWIALVCTILSGVATIVVYISFLNAKKDVLKRINEAKETK